MTETQTYQPRVVRPLVPVLPPTELWVPHERGEIAFAHPSKGPNTYSAVGKAILDVLGQLVPTGDYTASLLHSAYCSPMTKDEPEFQEVRERMKNRWLWVFNRNLWTEKGVYVLPDLKAVGRGQPLNINDLEEMLKGGKEINGIRFSQDERARFAPKGSYKLGEHTPESLAKDGFVIAGYNFDGAENLGEVSSTFNHEPKTFGVEVEQGQTPELRVSAVVDDGDRLVVDGGWLALVGRAFGVLK